jgi:hypothetical protein
MNERPQAMSLGEKLRSHWSYIQVDLFPWLDDAVGPLTERHQQLVTVLELVGLERFVRGWDGLPGRPPAERPALARAFIAKAVFNFSTTSMLIERLQADRTLRRLCGWERAGAVPSESTFSRAFAEFAKGELASRLHAAVIERTHADRLVGHISRDGTAIEARETPVKAARRADKPKRGRGRPKKGEEGPKKEPRRIERQVAMTLAQMLDDLPKRCDIGAKRNAKGHQQCWNGYKLHIDTADGDIPISCILTSASVNDSQVAIPLATMTKARVTNLYDVMDSAYDVPEIHDHSRSLGHIPIIDPHPRTAPRKQAMATEHRCRKRIHFRTAEEVRYDERTAAERVNARLKDDHGGRAVRVRGHTKVLAHLMFGVLVLTTLQLVRLVT